MMILYFQQEERMMLPVVHNEMMVEEKVNFIPMPQSKATTKSTWMLIRAMKTERIMWLNKISAVERSRSSVIKVKVQHSFLQRQSDRSNSMCEIFP